MEGDGKIPKHDTSIDEQESLPPLTHDDMDAIQDSDLSTGYNCLRFLMVNHFMSKRLGPDEYTWIFNAWRKQVIMFTKSGVSKSLNPMNPDSNEPNKRLIKEVEFELHMAKVQKGARLTSRDRGFLQRRCERCFRRPGRRI